MAVLAQHWWPHHASQRHHKVVLTGRCASNALPARRHIQPARRHIQRAMKQWQHLMAAVNTIKMYEPSYKYRCTQLICVARTKYENEYECFLKNNTLAAIIKFSGGQNMYHNAKTTNDNNEITVALAELVESLMKHPPSNTMKHTFCSHVTCRQHELQESGGTAYKESHLAMDVGQSYSTNYKLMALPPSCFETSS